MNKRGLLALYISGHYCHKIGTNPLAVSLLDNRLCMSNGGFKDCLKESQILVSLTCEDDMCLFLSLSEFCILMFQSIDVHAQSLLVNILLGRTNLEIVLLKDFFWGFLSGLFSLFIT